MRRRTFLSMGTVVMLGSALGGMRSTALSVSEQRFRIAIVGDCVFTSGLVRDDKYLQQILPILRGADVSICNFEGTLADAGTWAAAIAPDGTPVCGGLNIRGDDSVPNDLSWLGIDMVGTANNHAWDWGPEGVLTTIEKLKQAGVRYAGTGKDLSSAREPAYHDSSGRRTALISCASTYWSGTLASNSNSTIPGRPGVSPVRFRTEGSVPTAATLVDPRDLKEIVNSVRDAKKNADLVVVSCHTHESQGDRLTPPVFLVELAHACIDAGTDVFFSHGPHVLRGIEFYKGKPIFYSLGAFIFRIRETRQLPEEIYESCNMESREPLDYFERLNQLWEDDKEFWESIVAQIDFNGGKVTDIVITPIALQHKTVPLWGQPSLANPRRGHSILMRMKRLSEAFGAEITISDTVGLLQPKP